MRPNYKRINPFTQIAELHNRGVDYVFNRLKEKSTPSEEVDFEEILQIVSEYVAKIQNNNFTEPSESSIAANYTILANFFNMGRDRIIDEMLLQKEVPQCVIKYLDRVRNLSDRLSSEEIIEELSDIENDLLNSSYTNDEIKYVLLYLAIAKGSLKDWVKNSQMRFPPVQERRGWPWKEDADSALQAALVAPLDFFMTGGTLTIVSLVGGSIVASTWSAIKNRR